MTDTTYVMPTKRVASGALLLNQAGDVLLVNPTYKPEWEIPGGLVEQNEAPLNACIREVAEEIGLQIEPGRLLSLDYRQASGRRGDMLRFVFWGGELTSEQIAEIRLDPDELSEWGFYPMDGVRERLTSSLSDVVAGCLELIDEDRTQYLEFGEEA